MIVIRENLIDDLVEFISKYKSTEFDCNDDFYEIVNLIEDFIESN